MQQKVITALIIAALVASSTAVYAADVTWDYTNDVLVSYADEDKQQAESHIVASGSNNNYLVTALMDNTTTSSYRCRAYNSTDAGNTWTDRGFLPVDQGEASNDPVVASTTDGRFFIASSFTSTSSRIVYWVSNDNGSTWSGPNTVASASGTVRVDKPWIVADTKDPNSQYRNNVYACWTEINGSNYAIKFRKIWPSLSSVITIASPSSPSWVQWCNMVVGKSGIIYITWMRYDSTTNTYDVRMKRSFDGGATWTTASTIATFNYVNTVYSYGSAIRISNSPHLAVDNDWNIHLVYVTKTSAGDTEIMYRKITNCTGTSSCTLSTPLNVSNNSKDQWEPAIMVSAKSNTVHITALDKRDDTHNNAWKLWHYHCHLSTNSCTNISTGTLLG
ncbi:MAG: sialidase family protein [Candidatus Nitrosocaldus sp.]|nr:glycoside hydrolase [Candidatus Nitrosocaldus sp.]MDW8274766.1 sialidase family protein [Candidatus Nitrosocaldus sp.]